MASLIDLMEFRSQLVPEDAMVLELAINSRPLQFRAQLVWEDVVKKTLTFEMTTEEAQKAFGWLMNSVHLTTPVYPSRKPGMSRVRVNAKQAGELWTFQKDGSQAGVYTVVVQPKAYLNYQVGEKRLSGWYLKLVSTQR